MNTATTETPRAGAASSRFGNEHRTPATWLVVAAFAAVYIIWGSTYLGIHLAIQSIPPFLMAGARFLIAGTLLYAITRMRGAPRPQSMHWGSATVIGALLLLVGNGGVTWAQQSVPSGVAALMIAATPLWINLLEWMRPDGAVPRLGVFAGLALGFAGVALIVSSKDQFGNTIVEPMGALALLIASVCWAAGSVFSRHARQSQSALLAIAMQMIAGGILLLVAGLLAGEASDLNPRAITLSSAWAFGYLTFVGSLVGFTAYVWLLQVSTPARVSTYAYVNPLIAVLLGRVFLDEPLPGRVILAGALIIAAVVFITRARSQPAER